MLSTALVFSHVNKKVKPVITRPEFCCSRIPANLMAKVLHSGINENADKKIQFNFSVKKGNT